MKIGFDVSQTGSLKAGCGVFADGLIRALARRDDVHEYVLYPTFGDGFWDPDWARATFQAEGRRFSRKKGHRSLAEAQAFWTSAHDAEAWLEQPDVVHANNFFCPTGLRSAKLVYTLYDTAVLDVPEYTTEANRLVCFEGMFHATLYADHIIAISRHTQRRFRELFPYYPADRVSVVYPGSRYTASVLSSLPPLAGLTTKAFWLAVGTLEPRKNYPTLLRAYAEHVKRNSFALPLAIAGGTGWMLDSLDAEIRALKLSDRIHLLGYVDDLALAWLLGNCFAFVYPSLYEGFGLPVLEAMSLGAPVVTSNATSLPEIVGDAGLIVEPVADALSGALDQLTDAPGLRDEYADRSLKQAQNFSWEAAATRVLEIYESVAHSHRYAADTSHSVQLTPVEQAPHSGLTSTSRGP